MIRETVAYIIDNFEDFLEKRGIEIKNDEKNEDEGSAIIYGSDFDELMNGIIDTLDKSGVHIAYTYNEQLPESTEEDLVIYVPSMRKIIKIFEGSGDNLDKEDIANGYKDYINYEIYDPQDIGASLDGSDGGMVMYKELIRDKYNSLIEAIDDILNMAYDTGINEMSYIILSGGMPWKNQEE